MHFPISLTHGAPRAFGTELRYEAENGRGGAGGGGGRGVSEVKFIPQKIVPCYNPKWLQSS